MTVKQPEVHSATQILKLIDELLITNEKGASGAPNTIVAALQLFDTVPCVTLADALAFLSMSHRLTLSILHELANGSFPDDRGAKAADRYRDVAIKFIEAEIGASNPIPREHTRH